MYWTTAQPLDPDQMGEKPRWWRERVVYTCFFALLMLMIVLRVVIPMVRTYDIDRILSMQGPRRIAMASADVAFINMFQYDFTDRIYEYQVRQDKDASVNARLSACLDGVRFRESRYADVNTGDMEGAVRFQIHYPSYWRLEIVVGRGFVIVYGDHASYEAAFEGYEDVLDVYEYAMEGAHLARGV